jgi:diaminopimelate epimerase
MHGLGNDFVVVDLRSVPAQSAAWFDDPQAIVALCDRRLGVGADGVLGLFAPSAAGQGALARLRIRNADGSEAEMCGNGLRCVVRYLADSRGGAERQDPEVRVETAAGLLRCTLTDDNLIEVAMGTPRWGFVQRPFAVSDKIFSLTTVSMGNPHAVMFCDDVPSIEALKTLATSYGPSIERHPLFPQRTNVEFVRAVARDRYSTVVWERGCGITPACGTGACATAVAACLTGRAEPGSWLSVELLGGPLSIRVEPNYSQVYMRGPAVTVFRGQLG